MKKKLINIIYWMIGINVVMLLRFLSGQYVSELNGLIGIANIIFIILGFYLLQVINSDI